ncbi:MAG: hypothetical protein Ct9H90mP9_1220 [Pseudomonadota bacterium]|nr:MAG: hypothetical protein Ct9H90mP9_1220 [Pseudomonadota bacterium]
MMTGFVVCDTTSVNLHKVLHAALSLKPRTNKVIAEADCFPSDLYVLEGVKASVLILKSCWKEERFQLSRNA